MDVEVVIKSTRLRVDFPNDLSLIQYTDAQNRQTKIQAKYLI